MTTAALRTDDIKKYNKNVMNRIFCTQTQRYSLVATAHTTFLAYMEQVESLSEVRLDFMNINVTSRARQIRPRTTSPILASGILWKV